MRNISHLSLAALTSALLSLSSADSLAQSSPNQNADASSSSSSWLPYTTSGYIGLSVGSAKLNTDCAAGLSCGDPNGSFQIYSGGMFSPYFGVQLGYLQLRDADRNDGTTKVSGANVVLLGVAPLGSTVSLLGRIGGTYGWTKTSVGLLALTTPSGSRNGFGPSIGAGLSLDFSRNWSLTADFDRHHLKFAGDEKKNVDVAMLGVKYRF